MERWTLSGGGTLTAEEERGRLRVAARCPRDDRGLYKLWLTGPGEGRFPAGTLIPEGDCLCLYRMLPRSELERAGCWPVTGGEVVLAFPFEDRGGWRREADPGRLLADPILRSQMGGPCLYRQEGEGFLLAVPFRTDRPMPLVSLFCLAAIRRVEGVCRAVWRFDGKGCPVAVHSSGSSGAD